MTSRSRRAALDFHLPDALLPGLVTPLGPVGQPGAPAGQRDGSLARHEQGRARRCRCGLPANAPGLRTADLPSVVRRQPTRSGGAGAPGGVVRGQLHQPLHAAGGHRDGSSARGRRIPSAAHRPSAVLRADLDLHRPARCCSQDPRRDRRRTDPGGDCGHPHRGHGTLMPGYAAVRRRWPRPPTRWPSCWPRHRAGHHRAWTGSRSSPNRTATTTR